MYKNTPDKYNQSIENRIWITVSNILPFHNNEEYPKNWIISLMNQNTPMPKHILLPIGVSINSWYEVTHNSPTKKTINAIKKVWTIIICLLIKDKLDRSSFHLKYLGNTIWTSDNPINKKPIILSCISISKGEFTNKRSDLLFDYLPIRSSKTLKPCFLWMKMQKTNVVS